MNIAIFHNLPGGGSIRVIGQQTNHLVASGHVVDVYAIREIGANLKRENLKIDINETTVKPWSRFIKRNLWIYLRLPQIYRKIAKEINGKNYDLLIVHHDYFTKSPYILNFVKCKKIYVLHEPQREFYESSRMHAPTMKDKIANILRYPIKIIDQYNARQADLIIANSKYSKKVIQKVYRRNSKVIYPTVDTKLFKPKSPKNKKNIILTVGPISRIKGQDFIVESLKPILGEYKLILIGSGKQQEVDRLRKLAGNKSKCLMIIDKIDDKKLVELYQSAKVVCIGAYLEPFGLTSIEAQACGTPVVAISEGGIPETIINGQTGFLTSRNKNEFLRKTKIAIEKNSEMGVKARKNALRFKQELQNQKLDKIIKSINAS